MPLALPAVTRPSFLNDGAELGEALGGAGARVLVDRERDGALAGLDLDGDDLVVEPAGGLGLGPARLAAEREGVGVLAGDAVACSPSFSAVIAIGHPGVGVDERLPEEILSFGAGRSAGRRAGRG
jgi:hypothetical protein